ncbi:hypothetical protein CDO73_17445 [Saccharibacillus sp. O23]|uniref:S-layer homology domain-containing protein n=1 Tax=Saccharibacillus sp. O23 TaxID=2009338 RepID=UPI000B4E3067|nr:S-layer homology domain-containing protein [Saccharibacillus sp. O23]OWR28685.1 hypothetical protein CDO73_17445 [Saccharibacillus sp. O23]
MKKSVSSVLSVKNAAVSAIALTSLAAPFSALAASDAAAPGKVSSAPAGDVERAQARGILLGDAQGRLGENQALTRAEFAVLIARAFDLDTPQFPYSSYKDVAVSSWASPAAEALRAKGWMSGSGSAFLPNAPVTQEQMASVLAKALGLSESPLSVPGAGVTEEDLAAASGWARGSLKQAASAGLLGVYANGIKPGQAVLRGEAASAVLAASNLRPQVVEAVGDGTVKLGGVTYAATAELAGLFSAANQDALIGAKVRGYAANGSLRSVYGLELNASGKEAAQGQAEFSGNVALNGGGSKIAGSVTVNGDFYTLNNLAVAGDLTIGSKVEQDFSGSGLEVAGATNVLGGDENTVAFSDSKLQTVAVGKPNVRVKFMSGTTLTEIHVNANANIESEAGVRIPKMTVDEQVSNLKLSAEVGSLLLTGSPSVNLGTNASIVSLSLPSGVSPLSLISNFSAFVAKIGTVNGQTASSFIPQPVVASPPVSNPNPPAPSMPSEPSVPADSTALNAAIADAELALTEAAGNSDAIGTYPQLNVKKAQAAIRTARSTLADPAATQQTLNQAVNTLTAETATLRASKNYTLLTRRLAQYQADYGPVTPGAGPRQAESSLYEAYQAKFRELSALNTDPFVELPDQSSKVNELDAVVNSLYANIVAWNTADLIAEIAQSEKALIQYADTRHTKENVLRDLEAAKAALQAYQKDPLGTKQEALDTARSNLNISNYLYILANGGEDDKNADASSGGADTQQLVYDEKSDSIR